MWNSSYFNATYFNASYWPKVGATGAVAQGRTNQYLPLMGIGSWLLAMLIN